MTETILIVVAVLAALAIAARRAALPGRNYPEPLDPAAELPESKADVDADR
jgi:hypothetical protein